jgi:hypothetical protein
MSSPRASSATRRLVGVVLLALLVAQWTALAHAIGHAQAIGPAAAAAPAAAHGDQHGDEHADGHTDGHGAWGHAAGAPSCLLLDHLLHGQATGSEPAPLPCLPPPAQRLAAPAPSMAPGPAWRAFEARGPPRA